MSDESSSDGEPAEVYVAVKHRAKREGAGNLYESLRPHLNDEEVLDLFDPEDEADLEEYEDADKPVHNDEDDDAMSSSDDDADAGPPKEGEADDLEGEKALKKAERVEARRNKKLEDAKRRAPAWAKRKAVTLADDAKMDDGASDRPKKKKKSERSNWLPSAADAPTRQSHRTLAVTNREITHEHLKQSAARSEKQKKIMKDSVEQKTSKRADLTQEQRLAKVARIEKETERDFGRWEREEAERQRIREELLAAKRRRGADTEPQITHWSGSVVWVGDAIEVQRVPTKIMRVQEAEAEELRKAEEEEEREAKVESQREVEEADVIKVAAPRPIVEPGGAEASSQVAPKDGQPSADPQQALSKEDPQVHWLDGIQAYAAQPAPPPQAQEVHILPPVTENRASGARPQYPHEQQPLIQLDGQPAPQFYHGWPPGSSQYQLQAELMPLPPPPPPPLLREQAHRSLLILERFTTLDTPPPPTSKRSTKASTSSTAKDATTTQFSTLEPTALSSALCPDPSHRSFTPDETRYLTAKPRKHKGELHLPAAPAKPTCPLTSWPARYRDPRTGLPYADLQTYKMLQRLVAGGCAWSGLLGAWVGPRYGETGRPARGVPVFFAAVGDEVVAVQEGGGAVKVEEEV